MWSVEVFLSVYPRGMFVFISGRELSEEMRTDRDARKGANERLQAVLNHLDQDENVPWFVLL